MKLTIGETNFISKANAKETIRNIIYDIGVTVDVNNKLLYDLIKKHYDYENKTKNMKTLGIEKCENGLRLTIHNNNNTQTEISWHCCLDGPKSTKTLLNAALRTSVDSQIWHYRCRNFPSPCQLCDEEATQVDHIYEFHKIRDDFLNTYQGKIPDNFTKKPKTHRPAFLQNEPIEALFQEYHRKVATYQPLCRNCNQNKKLK